MLSSLPGRTSRDVIPLALLFLFTFVIFFLSPVHQITDSSYSMLLSESLLHHRSFQLDNNYQLPRGEPKWFLYYFRNGDVYQLEQVNGRIYYHLPPGGPVLSI